ncbi:hypothetical protein ElyMa_002929400 [Elysia marginata]|uniref:Uncharacterized protein n=1 Tax=Elysia marginata TaxID=1093978 RepID=A0AAV4I6K7_9GAST|nr:hypothetical protein ElyMa_002929400 [Elysia marginata]
MSKVAVIKPSDSMLKSKQITADKEHNNIHSSNNKPAVQNVSQPVTLGSQPAHSKFASGENFIEAAYGWHAQRGDAEKIAPCGCNNFCPRREKYGGAARICC